MPDILVTPLTVFVVVCTAHYFYTLFHRPALFDELNRWRTFGKMVLYSPYVMAAAMGVFAMIYLGLREAVHVVTSSYPQGWAENFVCLVTIVLGWRAMKGFESVGKAD